MQQVRGRSHETELTSFREGGVFCRHVVRVSCLGLIIRGKSPGIGDMLPRGHDAFISDYALACVFPNDGEQLLDHLMAVHERNTALASERPE